MPPGVMSVLSPSIRPSVGMEQSCYSIYAGKATVLFIIKARRKQPQNCLPQTHWKLRGVLTNFFHYQMSMATERVREKAGRERGGSNLLPQRAELSTLKVSHQRQAGTRTKAFLRSPLAWTNTRLLGSTPWIRNSRGKRYSNGRSAYATHFEINRGLWLGRCRRLERGPVGADGRRGPTL